MSCQGLPENIRVIADKVNPKRFYAVDAVAGLLYSSEDGGATFHTDTLQLAVKTLRRGNASLTNRRGDPRGGQDRIYSTPGREGDLWIAAYDGLYHSTTRTGFDFRALDKVRTIYAFGFGKAKPGSNYPALYLIGVVNGQYGFFRSDDAAVSWMRINDDAHQYGLVLHICGDRQCCDFMSYVFRFCYKVTGKTICSYVNSCKKGMPFLYLLLEIMYFCRLIHWFLI